MDPTSTTTGPDNDATKSPSPPEVMSKSTNISQSKAKLTDSGSHQATSGPTLEGRSSYTTIAETISNERLDSAASASPGAGGPSSQPSQTKKARPTDNQSTDVPAALSKDRQATAQRSEISKFNVEVNAQSRVGQLPTDADNTRTVVSHPAQNSSDISASKENRAAQLEGVTSPGPILLTSSMQRTTQTRLVTVPPSSLALPSQVLPGTGSNITLGVPELGEREEKNESLLHQVDPSRERNATAARAQQVDRTASVQPSAKPFISSQPLNIPTASMSPLPSHPVPAFTKSASNQVKSTHHRSGEGHVAPPDEPSRIDPSGTPHRPPSPPDDHGVVATEPPSQSQPVSVPHRLDKSSSRLKGSDGVDRGAQRATEGPTSDKEERKGATAPEEYEGPDDSHPKAPAESSVGRTYSSNPSRGNDSNSAPPLGRKETSIAPPPLALVSTHDQPKHIIRVPPNGNSTVFSVNPQPNQLRSPSVVGESHIPVSPFRKTSFDLMDGYESQVQPGLHSRIEPSLHEQNPMAALDGRYHSEPFIGHFQLTSSSSHLPIHSGGVIKQKSASNLRQAKFQQGGLNQLLAAERLTANPNTDTFGDEPITTQPAPLELNHPLAIETRQGAGPAQPGPSDDEIRGGGQLGSSGGGGTPGGGSPPEQSGEDKTTKGNRPPEQPGRSGPQGGNPQEPPGDAPPRPGQIVEDSDASTSCWPCCK